MDSVKSVVKKRCERISPGAFLAEVFAAKTQRHEGSQRTKGKFFNYDNTSVIFRGISEIRGKKSSVKILLPAPGMPEKDIPERFEEIPQICIKRMFIV